MTFKKSKMNYKREVSNMPSIGSTQQHNQHYSTVKKNFDKKILNKNHPRSLVSIKSTPPHDISGTIIKPIKPPSNKQVPLQKNDNEEKIQNCISKIDEVFISLSNHLASSEFKDLFGSIKIPENLISCSEQK